MSTTLLERQRSHTCNQLTKADLGKEVVLMGWVDSNRDHHGRIFIDLRDRYGITQLVFKPELDAALRDRAHQLGREYCVGIRGVVEDRAANGGSPNPRLPTGEVEISAVELALFNAAETPPFLVEDKIETSEEKRLAHRTVDLRRPRMQRNLIIRHKLMQAARRYLDGQGFLEMETPLLVKYTPGGARNFLVPSRLNPGKFYALAESPQLYKQMFMMAGLDRYFQIVKCFRDEDLRGDRQPEFTQIDIELSWATERVVQTLVEGLVADMFKEALGVTVERPFQRMSYDEAMSRFGSDKPDLRFAMEHTDLTDIVKKHQGGGIKLFADVVATPGNIIKAMVIEKKREMSRTEVDKLEDVAKGMGSKGVGRVRLDETGQWTQGPFGKAVTPEMRAEVNQACGAKAGDVILFQLGKASLVHTVLGGLRLHLRDKLGLVEHDEHGVSKQWKILWVTDFPLFEYDEIGKTHVAAHHPFTSPQAGHEDKLTSDPGSCRARAYDLVLNGNEVAGGSIRIHDGAVQSKVFTALGISEEDRQRKFGFLLEAMKYGCPPHGGIALGFDRWAMLFCGGTSLRDVIAYPKTQKGTCLLTDAPTAVSEAQLKDLFIASTAPQE
ncbi:MAG: aspartate--tRNA ligase [Deltaproteobacteria bacterium]|nr:aspartate--tRNA ligase [Deltaproteobacteria bacterium]